MQLYPMKFTPIIKETIWGGKKLNQKYNKGKASQTNIGESWELSGIQENISIVENGFLAENDIQELIEVYMSDLVGDKVYKQFGIEFPLLFKFIDANDQLSIQVHPDDKTARQKHKAYGKTEMWYIIDAEKDATIINGFKKNLDKEEYLKHLNNGTIEEIVNRVSVTKGDVIYIPAGRVHSIGKGVVLAEIQQTSDITYRIYDWNRKGLDGNLRELHTDLAIDVINFDKPKNNKEDITIEENKTSTLIDSPVFKTNIIKLDNTIEKDYFTTDSFIVYMCIDGSAEIITSGNENVQITTGETVLIPNEITTVRIKPDKNCTLLEVYL
ncbi:MAG: class I mannose-6-phosphate isomerase [Bacteroidales bacterium]|nr:class I mannose-6-phosphate isomerase [Bacteroidales bacterium]